MVGDKVTGKVMLSAVADDMEVWKEVTQKLNGLRVSTVQDLPGAMLEVTQKKLNEAKAELAAQMTKHHAEIEQERAKSAFLKRENEELRKQLFGLPSK